MIWTEKKIKRFFWQTWWQYQNNSELGEVTIYIKEPIHPTNPRKRAQVIDEMLMMIVGSDKRRGGGKNWQFYWRKRKPWLPDDVDENQKDYDPSLELENYQFTLKEKLQRLFEREVEFSVKEKEQRGINA